MSGQQSRSAALCGGNNFHAVSVSGGKDSSACLLLMIERDMPIDAVFWADVGMDFPEMHDHLAKLDEHLYRERGIHITTLRHPKGFEYLMFEEPKQKASSLENRVMKTNSQLKDRTPGYDFLRIIREPVLLLCRFQKNHRQMTPKSPLIIIFSALLFSEGHRKMEPTKGLHFSPNIERSDACVKVPEKLTAQTQAHWKLPPEKCAIPQLFVSLCDMVRQEALNRPAPKGKKKAYYFSMEFLPGKLLSNSLCALGIYEEVKEYLAGIGVSLSDLEELEPEPALGNGGLGRLGSCILDSAAALGLAVDGIGLNYHYGLFQQRFSKLKQTEWPDPWIEKESWHLDTGITFEVQFANLSLKAVMKDILLPGAGNNISNRLHLFDVEFPAPPPEEGIRFDKTDIEHHLTSFLYPDDSDKGGRLLRVYQQYFLVSSGAQFILKELKEQGFKPETLSDHVVVHINDTHASMVIPELIRLLIESGMTADDAIRQVSQICVYTNHTIMNEALEKWPLDYIRTVAPRIVPIIEELDKRAKKVSKDPAVSIIDQHETVHMAHMDIHYGSSINGVAALHTDILKQTLLKPFYDLYPTRFHNVTNGITFRRWLENTNPKLVRLIDECIGDGWKRDPMQLEFLLKYGSDPAVLQRILDIKQGNKCALQAVILRWTDVRLDETAIFDVQIKRLHEYKRQHMDAFYIIDEYLKIKDGKLPPRPVTVFFGAKAAPSYDLAKKIIHLILCLQKLINSDPQVSPWLRVVMVENYNIGWAEHLIKAADISEQISLASTEASGTGNMKFMLNGAVTLGTMDGANVEIAEYVGPENIYTFGASSEDVLRMQKAQKEKDSKHAYHPLDWYHKPDIERVVDFLLSPELMAVGDPMALTSLWRTLKYHDQYMAMLDLEDYLSVKRRMFADYESRTAWAKKMLINIAKAGFFSSDRTVRQYNETIWQLDK